MGGRGGIPTSHHVGVCWGPDGERCEGPHWGGNGDDGPDTCQHGCLFDLEGDPQESMNQFSNASNAELLKQLQDKLAEYTKTSPPENTFMTNHELKNMEPKWCNIMRK